jgi:hypothetical protein
MMNTITGLSSLYDHLLRIFRDTIAPSGGNNDAIHSALVYLLALAHDCAQDVEEAHDFKIDVIDYIFHI